MAPDSRVIAGCITLTAQHECLAQARKPYTAEVSVNVYCSLVKGCFDQRTKSNRSMLPDLCNVGLP